MDSGSYSQPCSIAGVSGVFLDAVMQCYLQHFTEASNLARLSIIRLLDRYVVRVCVMRVDVLCPFCK